MIFLWKFIAYSLLAVNVCIFLPRFHRSYRDALSILIQFMNIIDFLLALCYINRTMAVYDFKETIFSNSQYVKVVLEGYCRSPDSHDLSECHHMYDFVRHV